MLPTEPHFLAPKHPFTPNFPATAPSIQLKRLETSKRRVKRMRVEDSTVKAGILDHEEISEQGTGVGTWEVLLEDQQEFETSLATV